MGSCRVIELFQYVSGLLPSFAIRRTKCGCEGKILLSHQLHQEGGGGEEEEEEEEEQKEQGKEREEQGRRDWPASEIDCLE